VSAAERLRFLSDGALSIEPPPRLWLLHDSDGKPVVPLGEVGLLIGAGGTSKTFASVALAIAAARGGQWLERFEARDPGSVALFLAEESEDECRRRLYRVAQALELDESAKRDVEKRVLIAPLAGVSARLAAQGGNATEEAQQFHDELRQRADNWRLVIFDSLSRFGGADTEINNAAAADFIKILERYTALPGNPSVMCVHHTSQSSRDGARTIGPTSARGVTALVDNVRWAIAMAANDTGLVDLRIVKSNYGPTAPQIPELTLVRNEHGVLRPATVDDMAEASSKGRGDRVKARDGLEGRLIAEARRRGERHKTKSKLVEAVPGSKQEKLRVADRLIADGVLVFGEDGCHVVDAPRAAE
jgi:hypothetical protein